ncbi:MAG: hypothetical protein ACK50P_02080 [Planctomycetaceae bacterium]
MTSRWSIEMVTGPTRSSATENTLETGAEAVPVAESPVTLVAPRPTPTVEVEGIFVPEGYEPGYAYPLLVWLSTVPLSPFDFDRRMRSLSDRNYLGVCVPVSQQHDVADLASLVESVVGAMRREYHVHSERIIVVGMGDAAPLALEVALRQPRWFGGVIALGPAPKSRCLLAEAEHLRGFRVFLGGAPGDEWSSLKQTERLLWTAGMSVKLWQWTEGSRIPSSLWRQVNHWLMAGIENEATVWV